MKHKRKEQRTKHLPTGKAKVTVIKRFKGTQRIVLIDGNGPFTKHEVDGFIKHGGERLAICKGAQV